MTQEKRRPLKRPRLELSIKDEIILALKDPEVQEILKEIFCEAAEGMVIVKEGETGFDKRESLDPSSTLGSSTNEIVEKESTEGHEAPDPKQDATYVLAEQMKASEEAKAAKSKKGGQKKRRVRMDADFGDDDDGVYDNFGHVRI